MATGVSLTDYAENILGNATLRGVSYTVPSALYAGLFTTACTDAAPGTEMTGSGYARQLAQFSAPSPAGTFKNSNAINFGPAGTDLGTATYVALFDVAGNYWLYGALANPVTINNGQTRGFQTTDLVVIWD